MRPFTDGLFERDELGVPSEGHLDGRDEVLLLERLDEVGERSGVTGLLHEFAL